MLDDEKAAELALFAGLIWEDDDREVLGPLMDASIVWANGDELDEIAAPIVEKLWETDLRGDIERALDPYEKRQGALDDARADLALGPHRSRIALAYVKQGAIDLSGAPFVAGTCLCCMEDGLHVAPVEKHEQIALDAAVSIVRHENPSFGTGTPSDEDRTNAYARVRKLGLAAARSLPRLSAALLEIAQGPLPILDDDRLWTAATAGK